jgi:hypothetical protein
MKPKRTASRSDTKPSQQSPALWTAAGIGFMVAALPVSLAIYSGFVLLAERFWPDSVAMSSLAWAIFLSLGSPMLVVGARLLNRARRIREARLMREGSGDTRSPVLYLRAFSDDEKQAEVPEIANINPLAVSTREENFVEALQGIGPVNAIGRPGETLPPLGARRIYVDDEAWQGKVIELMANASLVVLMLGKGDGLWWEIEQALRRVPPERLLFFGEAGDFPTFLKRAKSRLPSPVTMPKLRRLSLAPREYLLSFDSQGRAQFVRPVNSATLWRSNPRKPLLPVYHIALRPVFERLGVPWTPPPAPWLALVITIGIILTLISTITWLILTQA